MRDREINISKDKPFSECKLKREKYANALSSIIEAYGDGFVLAVNGKWGTGKSTFVKMWKQHLINRGYRTIYYNAWENDFTSEPMVGILGEIKNSIKGDEKVINKIIDNAASFSSKMLPTLFKTIASVAGMGQVADLVEKFSKISVDALNREINDYENKKNSLIEFRKELEGYIKNACEDKPLIFIVDELDRCRPDYAVEILEKIKHFFAVKGIVFVLSIDKEQLEHAVCGYYGSDKIDSKEYLRRFIDLEYILPEPNYEDYIEYLFDYYELYKYNYDPSFKFRKELIFHISQNKKLTLRQLNKVFLHSAVAVKAGNLKLEILFMLIFLKEYKSHIYNELKNKDKKLEDVAILLDNEFKEYYKNTSSYSELPKEMLFNLIQILSMFENYSKHSISLTSDILYDILPNASAMGILNNDNAETYVNIIKDFRNGEISNYTQKIELLEYLMIE